MAGQQVFLILLILFFIFYTGAIPQNKVNTKIIAELRYGEPCTPGQVYKVDCNSCHCLPGSHLACTKMACLRQAVFLRTACVPGEFNVEGCRRCFCGDDGQRRCGEKDCKMAGKLPTTHEAIHAHTKFPPSEQNKLPTLKNQASKCVPGSSYRVDCNTCLCLANGNLVCGKRLCPSFDDMHRVKAKNMTGEPCDPSKNQNAECVMCQCLDGSKVCEAKRNCSPAQKYVPLEKASDKCSPGMIYKQACNRCVCTDHRSLQCTVKSCLNNTQISQFNKLGKVRKHFVDLTR